MEGKGKLPRCQWVRGHLREAEEFVALDRPGVVLTSCLSISGFVRMGVK